jgi:CDP-paratose 2-epimerase
VTTLGVLEWFELGELERVERVAASLKAMGISRLRTGVSWADSHRPDGWTSYDRLLPRLVSEFDVLPCLHFTPPSLGLIPTIQSPPRRSRDFADFVDAFLDRYGSLFEWVELWNEPNNVNDWDSRLDPSWQRFCELVGSAAYWAQARGKRVVLGGMHPVDPSWLDLLAQRGVLGVVDAVGIHGFPQGWTSPWRGWEAYATAVRRTLERHGSPAQVWITEAGLSTWRHDELGQVAALVEAFDAPVERVYWYAAEDLEPRRSANDGFHVDERHYHFGLADAKGEPKLAARTLAAGGLEAARVLVELSRTPARRRGHRPATLITGGAGFVGTNLAQALISRGERVRLLDNLSRPGVDHNLRWLRERYGGRIEFVGADLRDRHALHENVQGVSSVFHLAAQVAVTSSLADPVLDFEVNLGGTLTLLDELRRLPEPPSVLFTSTNKVYGSLLDVELERRGSRWLPVEDTLRLQGLDESRPLAPCTPYGCSKGGADHYVLDWAKSYGLRATVVRMSCIYGPHQHGTEDQGWVAHLLLRALAGEPVAVYGDGAQLRDLLHAADLVHALLLLRDRASELAGLAFNVGGGAENTLSLLELLELIEDLHGAAVEARFTEPRIGDQRWYVSDTSRLRTATGWSPEISPAVGVEALYRRLRAPADSRERSTA